tara:strand:+ start:67612 stop:67779 length:168 start_codon:yes stop_codon:yes gene_type:complete
MFYKGLGYELLQRLAINFASTTQGGNSAGISKVGDNKQLLIAIVYALNGEYRSKS